MNENNGFNIEDLFNLAIQNQKENNLNVAKNLYQKILKLQPKFIEAHKNLGLIYQKSGELDNARKHYEEAIKINPKYANAYNNLGTLNAELGKYKEAIENYSTALKYKDDVKSAKENLISALTFSKSDNNNLLVIANNNLKKIQKQFQLEDYLKDESLKNFFQKSNQIIDSIKKHIEKIYFIETQTYRRNSQNLDCDRHHEIFNQFDIIPKFCFSCFKIQIEPQNVKELIKLFFIFDSFKFSKNNWRKCMIELRPGVNGLYKGFIYCSSNDEATEILAKIEPTLKKSLKYKLTIKRGCTEFYKTFSNFRETKKDASNFMNYNEKWKKIEVRADKKKSLIKKKFVDTITGFSLSDFIIINQWLNYAKLINDMSYKNINLEFFNSEHIYQEMSNQLEFRRKQFLC